MAKSKSETIYDELCESVDTHYERDLILYIENTQSIYRRWQNLCRLLKADKENEFRQARAFHKFTCEYAKEYWEKFKNNGLDDGYKNIDDMFSLDGLLEVVKYFVYDFQERLEENDGTF